MSSSSRQPASLACFSIFNPTIRPEPNTARPKDNADDDEDAEQQAQILFYTSKEQAVSKDRMLRQVGLAMALITFAG
jgi:hypothetical protein